MITEVDSGRDGLIGLGVLVLLTVALVFGEARQGSYLARADGAMSGNDGMPLIERPSRTLDFEVAGAIRELRVLPLNAGSRLDLRWAPDKLVLEEYQQAGF